MTEHRNPVAAAMAAMGSVVKKDARNKHGGYDYASADAIYEHSRMAIAEAGLSVWMDEKKLWTTTSEPNAQGKTTDTLWVRFEIGFSLDGITPPPKKTRERITATTYLTSPQSLAAVRTYAEKYWIRGKFMLATGDLAEDMDAQDPTVGGAPRLNPTGAGPQAAMQTRTMTSQQAAGQWGFIDGQEEGGMRLGWALDDPPMDSDIAVKGLFRKLTQLIESTIAAAGADSATLQSNVDRLFNDNDQAGIFDGAGEQARIAFFDLWKKHSPERAHPLGVPKEPAAADKPDPATPTHTIASGEDARRAGLEAEAAQATADEKARALAAEWQFDDETLALTWPKSNPNAAVFQDGLRVRVWQILDDKVAGGIEDEAAFAEWLDRFFEANSTHIGRIHKDETVKLSNFWAEHSPKARERLAAKEKETAS